jgi:hypothetical protein
MRSFRTIGVWLGAMGGTALAATALVSGCGGDDSATGSAEDSGIDGTTDGTVDAPSVLPDGRTEETEGGGDGGTPEASEVGGGDGGDGSTGTSLVTTALLAYPQSQASAFCQRLETCCGADAGSFNTAKCVSDNLVGGWEFSLPFPLDILDAGHVALDPDASAACVNLIGNFACPTSSAAQYGNITTACYGALRGTIPIGKGPCTSTVECVSGSYCATVTADAGDAGDTTQCQALLAVGQPCGAAAHDTACAGSGTGNFCDRFGIHDAGVTCQPGIPNGSLCTSDFVHYDDESCQSLMCGDDWNCGTTLTQPTSFQCAPYRIAPDAGDGG